MKDTKKQYSAPEAEVIRFDSEDIVIRTTGGGSGGVSGHSTMMPRSTKPGAKHYTKQTASPIGIKNP